MDAAAIVLIVFLVIIFIVLIVGGTRYYDNPTLDSPLPLREPQIDPERELDLYVIAQWESGLTVQNLVYEYKNVVVVLGSINTEFNFSDLPPTSTTYSHSNVNTNLDSKYFTIAGVQDGQLINVYFNGLTIGIIRVLPGREEYLYSMIKAFESTIEPNSQWLVVYQSPQSLYQYSNEFRIYPTIFDPDTKGAFKFGIISSLDFNYNISVATIIKLDKGLHIKMKSDNMIESTYPETTTVSPMIEQDTSVDVSVSEAITANSLHSQGIINELFP